MIYEIDGYVGAGPIRFGMTKEEISTKLGEKQDTFKRNDFANGETEVYGDCMINYNKEGKCESVEFLPSAEVLYKGKSLFKTPCNKNRELLGEVTDDDCGFTSHMCGFGVYAPDEYEEPGCLPESIIIFERGYGVEA